MGRGSGTAVADTKALFYGKVPGRDKADLAREKLLGNGVIEHYNSQGLRYKIVIPRGCPHPLLPAQISETAVVVEEDVTVYVDLTGKLHRDHGPAIEFGETGQQYWVHGRLHRDDGPAIEWPGGRTEYWVGGQKHRDPGPAVILRNGDKDYWVEGKRHREDGPAVDHSELKEWHINGELHREDGPAIEYPSGAESWYQHGLLHREDGPALIRYKGDRGQYWLKGKQYESKDDWEFAFKSTELF